MTLARDVATSSCCRGRPLRGEAKQPAHRRRCACSSYSHPSSHHSTPFSSPHSSPSHLPCQPFPQLALPCRSHRSASEACRRSPWFPQAPPPRRHRGSYGSLSWLPLCFASSLLFVVLVVVFVFVVRQQHMCAPQLITFAV